MRGGHDLDPHRRRQLALGQHPAHLVVQDLGGGTGDRAQPRLAQAVSHSRMLIATFGHPVGDLHRGKRVHVHRRHPGLDGAHQIGVAGDRQLGVDTALHAHFGRTRDVRLPRPFGHLVGGQRIRVGVALALGERAEPAAGVADVGEIDVAVDDERHFVAHHVAAQRIRKRGNRFHLGAVGGGQRQILVVGAAGGIALGRAQARRARRCRSAPGRAPPAHAPARGSIPSRRTRCPDRCATRCFGPRCRSRRSGPPGPRTRRRRAPATAAPPD